MTIVVPAVAIVNTFVAIKTTLITAMGLAVVATLSTAVMMVLVTTRRAVSQLLLHHGVCQQRALDRHPRSMSIRHAKVGALVIEYRKQKLRFALSPSLIYHLRLYSSSSSCGSIGGLRQHWWSASQHIVQGIWCVGMWV